MYFYVVLSTITVIIATHYFLKLRKRKPSTHQIYKNEIENNVPEILESIEESSNFEQNRVQSEIYCTSTNDFERKNLLRKKLYSQFHYLLVVQSMILMNFLAIIVSLHYFPIFSPLCDAWVISFGSDSLKTHKQIKAQKKIIH